jgi:hypothetical protein
VAQSSVVSTDVRAPRASLLPPDLNAGLAFISAAALAVVSVMWSAAWFFWLLVLRFFGPLSVCGRDIPRAPTSKGMLEVYGALVLSGVALAAVAAVALWFGRRCGSLPVAAVCYAFGSLWCVAALTVVVFGAFKIVGLAVNGPSCW